MNKKTTHFVEGGDAGNREDQINRMIRRMNWVNGELWANCCQLSKNASIFWDVVYDAYTFFPILSTVVKTRLTLSQLCLKPRLYLDGILDLLCSMLYRDKTKKQNLALRFWFLFCLSVLVLKCGGKTRIILWLNKDGVGIMFSLDIGLMVRLFNISKTENQHNWSKFLHFIFQVFKGLKCTIKHGKKNVSSCHYCWDLWCFKVHLLMTERFWR